MNKEPVSVILVDDHPVVMEGLRSLLEKNESLEVQGAFTTGKDTMDFLERQSVDLVLLDISLPDISGTELCLKIKAEDPGICVLVISNHNERSLITQMLQNGASGYILKNASAEELNLAIQNAVEGALALTPEVKKILAKGETSYKKSPRLTRREKEVLKLVAKGMTTAAIAEKLYISPLTVETHRRNLMQKFEVKNTAALIRMAVEQKMIS